MYLKTLFIVLARLFKPGYDLATVYLIGIFCFCCNSQGSLSFFQILVCSSLPYQSPRPGAYRGEMAPGARSKFGAPMFEPEVFRREMHCIEERTCDNVGTFRRPQSIGALRIESAPMLWFGAQGIVPPPRYAPDQDDYKQWKNGLTLLYFTPSVYLSSK